MTGPEHYCEAEDLIAMATEQMLAIANDDPTAGLRSEAIFRLQSAQVHATLALAAATALASHDEYDSPDHMAWHDAASLTDPAEEPPE